MFQSIPIQDLHARLGSDLAEHSLGTALSFRRVRQAAREVRLTLALKNNVIDINIDINIIIITIIIITSCCSFHCGGMSERANGKLDDANSVSPFSLVWPFTCSVSENLHSRKCVSFCVAVQCPLPFNPDTAAVSPMSRVADLCNAVCLGYDHRV